MLKFRTDLLPEELPDAHLLTASRVLKPTYREEALLYALRESGAEDGRFDTEGRGQIPGIGIVYDRAIEYLQTKHGLPQAYVDAIYPSDPKKGSALNTSLSDYLSRHLKQPNDGKLSRLFTEPASASASASAPPPRETYRTLRAEYDKALCDLIDAEDLRDDAAEVFRAADTALIQFCDREFKHTPSP